MSDTKKLTKTEQYVHLLGNLADLDCVNHGDLVLLKEIKERVSGYDELKSMLEGLIDTVLKATEKPVARRTVRR